MKNKHLSRWVACLILGVVEAILVSQVPRVLTHTSNAELHQVLYLNRSLMYWLFLLAYVCSSIIVAVLWILLLLNRSTVRLTDPIRRFLSRRRSFSWSEVVLVVLITSVAVCVPEILARAMFIHRYSAPWMLLVPYLERFDQNIALYGYTRRSGRLAHNDIVAFRQAQFEYRPYVGFSPVPDFRPTPTQAKKAFRVFFVGGSAMEISAARAVRDLQERLNLMRACKVEVINAGRSAYVSGQEVVMTLMEVLPLQPDLIIVFDGVNDISRVEEGEAPGAPEYTRAMEASFKIGMNTYQYLLNDVAQRSFLVQRLKIRRSEAPSASPGEWRAFDKAVEIYGSNVERMTRLARVYKYGLIVAIQPLVFFRDHLGPSEAKLVAQNPERAQLYHHYFPQLIERAKAIARDEPASFRDLSRVFEGVSGDVFYDSVHFDGDNAAVRDVLRAEFENMILSFPGACGL